MGHYHQDQPEVGHRHRYATPSAPPVGVAVVVDGIDPVDGEASWGSSGWDPDPAPSVHPEPSVDCPSSNEDVLDLRVCLPRETSVEDHLLDERTGPTSYASDR